jgi:hypothetical protein
MRILRPVVLILLMAVLDTGQHFGLRGTVALKFVCDDHTTLSRYLDPKTGLSADEADAYALTHSELAAFRSEIEAGHGLVKQASLRRILNLISSESST